MESFVNKFIDKRISIETLDRIVKVKYQRDVLLELALKNYQSQNFEVTIVSDYILKLENEVNLIFLLLSGNNSTLELIKERCINTSKCLTFIVFEESEKFKILESKVVVNTKDWMNGIISHGINRQILDLQYLRDMEYYYA